MACNKDKMNLFRKTLFTKLQLLKEEILKEKKRKTEILRNNNDFSLKGYL